jgi:ABC-type transport system substrate-binding protein
MAIDVQSIIRHVLYGEGERVTGPYASVTDWYDARVPALAYDPAGAQRLLAEAGYVRDAQGWLARDGERLEFNLITNNGNLRRKAVATIVQQAWRRIGIKCNVQLFEWTVFLKDFVNPGQFDAVVLGWQMGLDPDLFQLWHSSQSRPNELNFVGFDDARSDELIEAIRREYDRNAQRRLAHQLHARIAELQPYTFLFAPRVTRLLDRKIVMLAHDGTAEPVRAGGAGDLFFHLNRWQRLAHDPGF